MASSSSLLNHLHVDGNAAALSDASAASAVALSNEIASGRQALTESRHAADEHGFSHDGVAGSGHGNHQGSNGDELDESDEECGDDEVADEPLSPLQSVPTPMLSAAAPPPLSLFLNDAILSRYAESLPKVRVKAFVIFGLGSVL